MVRTLFLIFISMFLWAGCSLPVGHEDKQIDMYQKLAEKDPSPANLINLGWLYYEKGEFKEAEVLFQEVVEADENNVVARYNLALADIKLERLDEASKHLEKLLTQQPDHSDALLTLGDVYLQKKAYKNAQTCFKNFLKLDPTSANGLKGLGDSYVGQGERERAQAAYQLALNYAPTFLEAKEALEKLEVAK